jgi:hypothetical protein
MQERSLFPIEQGSMNEASLECKLNSLSNHEMSSSLLMQFLLSLLSRPAKMEKENHHQAC